MLLTLMILNKICLPTPGMASQGLGLNEARARSSKQSQAGRSWQLRSSSGLAQDKLKTAADTQMAPDDRHCALRGNHTNGNAEVDSRDMERLQPGGWLNGPLVDYKLFLHAAAYYGRGFLPSDFTFLPSYVWARWDETQEPWYRPATKTNPLLSRFIAMPCCVRRNHWILVIVVYASELLELQKGDPRGQQPAILIFDSFPSLTPEHFKSVMETKLKALITKIADGLSSNVAPEGWISSLPVYYPEVCVS